MPDFPEPEAVDTELASFGQLAVLYCHGCCEETTHKFHKGLAAVFKRHGMELQCDKFKGGDDVQVAMRRFEMHGVIFHADEKSILSKPCATERTTARTLGVPIMTLCDNVPTPIEERDRISVKLPARASITPEAAESLARQMRERARTHRVLCWLAEGGRSVEEREAGAVWLRQQNGQVLAEFFPAIVRLHRGEEEDPTVSARLAEVLERTNLRSEARLPLLKWHGQVSNPLSKMTIEDILAAWGCSVGAGVQ